MHQRAIHRDRAGGQAYKEYDLMATFVHEGIQLRSAERQAYGRLEKVRSRWNNDHQDKYRYASEILLND